MGFRKNAENHIVQFTAEYALKKSLFYKTATNYYSHTATF